MHLGRRPSSATDSDSASEDAALAIGAAGACPSGPGDPSTPVEGWDGIERRSSDRRERPTLPWTGRFTPRRRAGGRRASDRVGYVDRYSRQDVALLLTIFVLNLGDAFFTLLWLSRGGLEANPVMDFFLDIGPWAFLLQKCVVVGLWLILLVVHKSHRLARLGLYSALVIYGLLMVLHFAIVTLDIEPPNIRTDPPTVPIPEL